MLGGSGLSISRVLQALQHHRELHLMRFDKLLDALTLFFSSDFARNFFCSVFPSLFTVKVSRSFPAIMFIWRLRRMAVNLFQDSKLSATRTVVSIEILYCL